MIQPGTRQPGTSCSVLSHPASDLPRLCGFSASLCRFSVSLSLGSLRRALTIPPSVALLLALAILCPSLEARAQSDARDTTSRDTTSRDTAAAAQPDTAREKGAYIFALAKVLADEGSYREALQAFEEAVLHLPADPYVRTEYAEFLVHLAELARAPLYRQQHLRQAVEQVEEARRLAPENLEVLRVVGDTYLTLAEFDPSREDALDKAQSTLETIREGWSRDTQSRLSLGQIYMYRGRPEAAADVYREVVSEIPGNRRVQAMLVDALLRSGQTAEAKEELARSLTEHPDAADVRLQLAEMQAQAGDAGGAVETLEAGGDEVLSRPEVQRFLAFQRYLAGDLEGALASTDVVLKASEEAAGPVDSALARLRSVILASLGRNEEAIDQLQRLLAEDPEDIEISVTLSEVLQRQGRVDDAVVVLQELIGRLSEGGQPSTTYPVRLQLAELLLDHQRWSDVERVLQPMLNELSPDAAQVGDLRLGAELLLAEALVQQERGEEALTLLENGSRDQPANVAKRAELLLRLERSEEGVALLRGLVEGGDQRAVVPAVLVYQRLERNADAIELLETARKTWPQSPEVLFLLGAAYETDDRYEDAATAFQALLEIDPEHEDALNYLGYMWAERGEKLEQALDLIQRAVARRPDSGAFVDSLGWVYYQLGRYAEALEQLERAAQLQPGDAVIFEHLGDTYRALGQDAQARDAYRRALELEDEENVDAVREKLREVGGE